MILKEQKLNHHLLKTKRQNNNNNNDNSNNNKCTSSKPIQHNIIESTSNQHEDNKTALTIGSISIGLAAIYIFKSF